MAGEQLVGAPHGDASAALLVADEVSSDGDRAEELVSLAADAVRPAGLVVLTALADEPRMPAGQQPRGVPADRDSPVARDTPRTYTAAEVEHLLLHRGLAVHRLERHGDRWLVVARVPVSEQERSDRFIASLPFKLVTAAVVCRDDDGRLLCVFDTYRRHWTIPGGVVDAGEDPRAGAVREAFEESGMRVRAGALLGVFSIATPDRLLLAYAARPVEPAGPEVVRPRTRQPQEVGEVTWLPVDEALARLNHHTRWQVERCLDAPGETWRE